MKSHRISPLALMVLVAALLLSAATGSAESIAVKATLILGSNSGEGVDSSLRQYERNLKRVLPFDSFKRQGSGAAQIPLPGQGSVKVGSGQTVSIAAEPAAGGKYRISTQWRRGRETLVDATIVASPNRPTVLVGLNPGPEKLILLLVAE